MKYNIEDYVGFRVKPTRHFNEKFGYRIIFTYPDGSKREQQKSGFISKKEADKAREKTIAELYNGTYIIGRKVKAKVVFEEWLKSVYEKTDSYSTYSTFKSCIYNHIIPELGNRYIENIMPEDIIGLYKKKTDYSESVAKMVKTVTTLSFAFAMEKKLISINPTSGINLPRKKTKDTSLYHTRNINSKDTLTMEQIHILIAESKNSPIYLQVLFNVLMGLRRSEIIGVKYSDINYIDRTLSVERQLGIDKNKPKDTIAAKTYTKQEIDLKSSSSHREIPIPDILYEAIVEERKKYEKNRNRRKREFQDLDYICCSSYGRPRSKDYHWKYYKELLEKCGLPDIRWHDLRKTYCTVLLKNDFSPKAVSKLMGHAKEVITVDVYGDNEQLIADCTSEISEFMKDVLPEKADLELDIEGIVVDTDEYFD